MAEYGLACVNPEHFARVGGGWSGLGNVFLVNNVFYKVCLGLLDHAAPSFQLTKRSVDVFINLFIELGKRSKMRGLWSILSLFVTSKSFLTRQQDNLFRALLLGQIKK